MARPNVQLDAMKELPFPTREFLVVFRQRGVVEVARDLVEIRTGLVSNGSKDLRIWRNNCIIHACFMGEDLEYFRAS